MISSSMTTILHIPIFAHLAFFFYNFWNDLQSKDPENSEKSPKNLKKNIEMPLTIRASKQLGAQRKMT